MPQSFQPPPSSSCEQASPEAYGMFRGYCNNIGHCLVYLRYLYRYCTTDFIEQLKIYTKGQSSFWGIYFFLSPKFDFLPIEEPSFKCEKGTCFYSKGVLPALFVPSTVFIYIYIYILSLFSNQLSLRLQVAGRGGAKMFLVWGRMN